MAYPYPNPSPTLNLPFANPVSIIDPHFCAPNPVDLVIIRKVLTITDGNFVVTDVNGNILFKVKEKFLSLHGRRVLLDGAGNPIVTLKLKVVVVTGLVLDAMDACASLKLKIDVFLANNTKEEVCDFTVKQSWLGRSCVIYAGESSTIVAQMHNKDTVESTLIGKDKFKVTVYPNIDYAFIVALFMILDAIEYTGGGGGGGE
ncbi:hypothetical protein V6N13_093201 [Hibiscus sabdariffa]|uniref:Protein LURP-one-related 15 n=1 Tax=Hibiscus sabdariffa TaxID=183260 RepID=A0ABR2C9E5_9ROSI